MRRGETNGESANESHISLRERAVGDRRMHVRTIADNTDGSSCWVEVAPPCLECPPPAKEAYLVACCWR